MALPCAGLRFPDVAAALMSARKDGAILRCQTKAPIALVVAQGHVLPYRLVCVGCGYESPWFELTKGGTGVSYESSFPPRLKRRRARG